MKKTTAALCFATTAALGLVSQDAAGSDEVKVFILAGQSNMQGHGRIETGFGGVNGAIGSLRYEVNNKPATYGHLVDTNGQWVTRDDVWVWSRNGTDTGKETGYLSTQFGVDDNRFGPELGFGHVVGDAYDQDVVLVKTAWGGKSLITDFRPPTAVADRGGQVGTYYNLIVSSYNEAKLDIAAQFPGKDIKLAGFGWHQGWNDRVNATAVNEYEENMADFISDIRVDLNAPDLPFVIANTGMSGFDIPDSRPWKTRVEKLMEDQLDLADPAEHPEFAGTVGAVETRGFWREPDVSPADQGFHWNQNGETYYLIGDAMGNEMLAVIPEPSSMTLLALGGLALIRRRRRSN